MAVVAGEHLQTTLFRSGTVTPSNATLTPAGREGSVIRRGGPRVEAGSRTHPASTRAGVGSLGEYGAALLDALDSSGHRGEHLRQLGDKTATVPSDEQRLFALCGQLGRGIVPRIDVITEKSQIPEDQYAEYDHIVEVLHGVRGPFGVLLHSPGLAEKVMSAGAQVRLGSTLTPVEREIAVIATSREKDAAYEWNSHVATGRKAGMREEVIDAIRARADVSGLEADERDIVHFVRQLLQKNRVEQSLFDELVARHSHRWVVELAATVGQYQYIAAINNTFEILPGPEADPLPIT